FREDLYYRLNVVQVRIPPLRERREDIPLLLSQFIERYGRRYGRSAADVPPEVVQRFLSYDWPGNVRELENLVRRLMVLRDPSYVYAEMRPRRGGGGPAAPRAPRVRGAGVGAGRGPARRPRAAAGGAVGGGGGPAGGPPGRPAAAALHADADFDAVGPRRRPAAGAHHR